MSLTISALTNFISETRTCTTREEEIEVIEIAKQRIREDFAKGGSLKNPAKMKSLWKMLFMWMMGYPINFGFQQAIELTSSGKLSEKFTGYVLVSVLLKESDTKLWSDVVLQVRNDLYSDNQYYQSLALSLIGNMAPTQLAGKLITDISKIALGQSDKISFFVRQKAILALLRIFRKFKDKIPSTAQWAKYVAPMLEEEHKLPFINSTLSLVLGIITLRPDPSWNECLPPIVKILENLVVSDICPANYKYYGINCPIIQVKGLRILSRLAVPKNRAGLVERIVNLLNVIIAGSVVSSNPHTNNTTYSIVFEAISVVIKYKNVIDFDLQNQILSIIVAYMAVPQPNIRYLALDGMTKVLVLPGADDMLNEQLKTILDSLKDKDTSIRRRALDLLYLMCNYNNVGKIVEELLNYTEETDMLIKEELVLKIAILAERFAPNLTWYIDVIIRLLTNSGSYITDDIWHRVVQIITGFGKDASVSLRNYAATLLFNSLSMPHVHETLVKVGSYVLAEFGELIADQIGSARKLFEVIHKHFDDLSFRGKSMLLTSYAKLGRKIPPLKEHILPVMESLFEHWDPELQLRAVEYHTLLSEDEAGEIRDVAFNQMPTFPNEIHDNNPLLVKMITLKAGAKLKDGEDPTLDNDAKRLIENQMSILKARAQHVASTNALSGVNYDDLFIETGAAQIKFSDCKALPMAQGRMALNGPNIMLSPNNIQLPNGGIKQLKATLLSTTGVIYEDTQLKINYRSQVDGLFMKIALEFQTKSGALNIHRALVRKTEGLLMKVSPIKAAQHPQLIINVQCIGVVNFLPMLMIKYNQNAQERTLEFALPIYIHHFIKTFKIPQDKYDQFYMDYSNTDKTTIFKLDEFLKEPVGPEIPLDTVLTDMGKLIGGGFHLQANKFMDQQGNFTRIWATGQYVYQAEGESQPVVLPVLLEVEGFPQQRGYLRVSLRCGGNPYIIHAIYQLIKFFVSLQFQPNCVQYFKSQSDLKITVFVNLQTEIVSSMKEPLFINFKSY